MLGCYKIGLEKLLVIFKVLKMEENPRISKSFFSASSYNVEKLFLLEYLSSKSNKKT